MTAWLGVMLVLLTGCEAAYRMEGAVTQPGIYRCASPVVGAPTYRFDSRAPTSLYWRRGLGTTVPRIEFRDLTSGQTITLYDESNVRYRCDRELEPR